MERGERGEGGGRGEGGEARGGREGRGWGEVKGGGHRPSHTPHVCHNVGAQAKEVGHGHVTYACYNYGVH